MTDKAMIILPKITLWHWLTRLGNSTARGNKIGNSQQHNVRGRFSEKLENIKTAVTAKDAI